MRWPRLRAFLDGVGSVLNISGAPMGPPIQLPAMHASADDALRSDMERVWGDFAKVLEQGDHQNVSKKGVSR